MNKKKKKLLIILTASVAVLFAIGIGVSYFIGSQVVASSTQLVTNEKTKNVHEKLWVDYNFDYQEFCQNYTIEKLNLTSTFDNHNIPADYIYSDSKNKNVVIMAHGLGGNRHTNYPIAKLFLENGYNVITYDQRSSGENTASKTTFGYWEKYDILDYINYVKNVIQAEEIGIWGESFGGATAIQAVGFEDAQESISFLVLDCPVSSMEWMVEKEIKNMNIGVPVDYLMGCGNIVNNMKLGFSYKDVDCAKIAKKIKIPTLVINSKVDTTTPYFMGKEIFDSLASEDKELLTSEDSEHVAIWLDYNQKYCDSVLNLIENN